MSEQVGYVVASQRLHPRMHRGRVDGGQRDSSKYARHLTTPCKLQKKEGKLVSFFVGSKTL